MKISTLLATLLIGLASNANAYESFQTNSIYYPETPWLRGTVNNWAKTALVAASAYKYTGVTYIGYINLLAGSQQIKFDTSTNANWSINYGDNYLGDTCLDQNGANLALTQGAGTYEVRFNSGIPIYGCGRPTYQFTKLNTYVANKRSAYLRTSFNDWKPLPMILMKDHVWEASLTGTPNQIGAMKFDTSGDWSASLGRPIGSDIRSYTNTGYASAPGGDNLGLFLEDHSGAAMVTVRIRLNDQTNQFAICRDTTLALCQ